KIKDEESRIALKITQEEAQSKQAEQDLQQADERKLAAQETLRLRRPDIDRGYGLQGLISSLEKQQIDAEKAKDEAVLAQD
ncbi:hypothetical protein AB9F41_36925, partial [Rhizobium leguminosarum]